MIPDFLLEVTKHWTLFLDRDGVINIEKEDGYILTPDQFFFIDQATNAMAMFGRQFGKIFIVTNQKGVGKGLMTETDLQEIHAHMLQEIQQAGGWVTKVYYATSADPEDEDRKPRIGMALKAMAAFPNIDFRKSIMVGNTLSDMAFGRSAGMYTVFIKSAKPMVELPHPLVDAVFNNIYELAKALQKDSD